MEKDFEYCGSERVYLKTDHNLPAVFEMSVESIGILDSKQLVYDAITIMHIEISDILRILEEFHLP